MAPVPRVERSTRTRSKTFQTHLLTSKENQLIIQKSHEATEKKEQAKKKKEDFVKQATVEFKKQNRRKAAPKKAIKAIKANPKL